MKNNFKNHKENLKLFSSYTDQDLFKEFNSSKKGLNSKKVEEARKLYGKNKVHYEKEETWFFTLVKSFLNPFIIILLIIILISFFTDVYLQAPQDKSWATVIIISLMVVFAVAIEFVEAMDSRTTMDSLKEMIKTTITVLRDNERQTIEIEDLVVGDIVILTAGDLVPADLRILNSKDLFLNQSSLTGESNMVEKESYQIKNPYNKNIEDLENICLMGTNVISGSGKCIVVGTGDNTYFGSIAQSMSNSKPETNFEKGVNSVSVLLIKFMLIMVILVFFINLLTKKDILSAFLFSVSIAVGLTPEMLPTILSSNLAKGAKTLSNKKIVVKNLSSIQSFGAMNILCTDKTGTLTLDQIVLEKYLNIEGREDREVLKYGFLNSYFQTGLKNLIDIAVINCAKDLSLEKSKNNYEKIDEIPFDFKRRRMSIVLRNKKKERLLITKGAIEEMLDISSHIKEGNKILKLKKDVKNKILKDINKLNLTGMRVLGVAYKENIPDIDIFNVADETNMVLIGYMGFLDPAKKTAKPAITSLINHGVDIKVLTGDNEFVTKKICKDLGIATDNILLGGQLDDLTDQELLELSKNTSIFAKLAPLEKQRIVRILKENNVVGFLGDGINDAPALQEADIGISVDTAVDIAKESADLILLEKNLNVLNEGVIEGRRVFGNILKYIKITASSNFGNVFSVLLASAFLPFLPMLPIQLLVQNLLYSFSQSTIPWDYMDEEFLAQPQQWDPQSIKSFMLYMGPVSSIFDILLFLLMWFVFKVNSPEKAPLFHSAWFTLGLLTQTLVVHLLRTSKIPFIESRPAKPLRVTTGLVVIIGLILPFSYLGKYIGLLPLETSFYFYLLLILGAYILVTEFMKRLYIKRFNHWI